MKLLALTFALILSSTQLFAQGQIQSLMVSPANPTTTDFITVYANCQFSHGGCDVDNQGHSINGFNITAYGHHCIGLLTVICPTTDTFEIGYLPAGDYTFDFTLSSGQGGAGCSPGIVPDGSSQIQFTVSASVGIDEVSSKDNNMFPNPTTGTVFFQKPIEEKSVLTDVHGKIMLQIGVGTTELNLTQFPTGIYFLLANNRRVKLVKN